MVKLSTFGAEMRQWRKRNLLSQKAFALAIGVVVRTIQGIESGEHKPSFNVYRKFRELKERYARNRRICEIPFETAFRRSRTSADSPQNTQSMRKIVTL